MILPDHALRSLIESGTLIIDPYESSSIGPTSIDLRVGGTIVVYSSTRIDLGRMTPDVVKIDMDPESGYELPPSGFVLARTLERIQMPNGFQGFIETKGDIARAGLQVHNGDGHVDPGSNHTITLEITNLNTIPVVLRPGIWICQLFVHELSGLCERPYAGKYLGQSDPSSYIADISRRRPSHEP